MSRPAIKFSVLSLLLLKIFTGTVTADLFDGCDHEWNINPGYTYLQSPDYPFAYPPGSSCRYKFTAPLDYKIKINCTIYLDQSTTSTACTTEKFYIALDGDKKLRGSEQFCGYGEIIRTSLFRSVVMAYDSGGSWGNFECQLLAEGPECDCGWSVNTRIVNGVEASANEYPSIVALTHSGNNQPYCGGTIIAHKHILSAAHCARVQQDPAEIIALVGQHDLNNENRYSGQYEIQDIIEHPYYTANPVQHDMAIFITVFDIEWSRGVGPACLPSLNFYNSFEYFDVDVVGWGTTSFGGQTANKLKKVTLMIQENSVCQQEYQGIATITSSQMCTYDASGMGKDSCQFDSGGPNILQLSRQFIIGCISFGKVCGVGNNIGYPMGVNTRVTSYLTWIDNVIGSTQCKVKME